MAEILAAEAWTTDQANSVYGWLQNPLPELPMVDGVVSGRLSQLGLTSLEDACNQYGRLDGKEADAFALYVAGFSSSVIARLELSEIVERLVPKRPKRATPKVARLAVSRVLSELQEDSSDVDKEDFVEVEDDREATLGSVHITADPVKDYLRTMGKTPRLTDEEVVELSKMIEAGLAAQQVLEGDHEYTRVKASREELQELVEQGKIANERFIKANLRLVVSIAKRYAGRGVPFLDLIQEGNIGLAHAIELYDHTLGFKFSTYATNWIRQSVGRANDNMGRTIRIPVGMNATINKISRARDEYSKEHGRSPSDSELLEGDMGITERQLKQYHTVNRQTPASLQQPVDDGDTQLGELVGADPNQEGPDVEVGRNFVREKIAAVLETFLDPREADVVRSRFGFNGEPETLNDIAMRYGLTKGSIHQIEAKTLSKLRHPSRAHHLRGLLGD